MVNKIKKTWKYIHEFNLICFITNLLSTIIPYKNKGNRFAWFLLQKKHNSILRYLSRYYYKAVKEDIHFFASDTEKYDRCIWTAWFQGEENAPEVIQLTLASIRKNANKHNVIVLTDENIHRYIDIPALIHKKYIDGTIAKAAYADIIRLMILARYGGIWVDATILMNSPFNETSYNMPFFSVGVDDDNSPFVSSNRWIAGIIGSKNNSKYSYILSKMFNSYWIDHDEYIDYFIIDYMITLLYNHDEDFKAIVDTFSKMKYHTNELRKVMNAGATASCFINEKFNDIEEQISKKGDYKVNAVFMGDRKDNPFYNNIDKYDQNSVIALKNLTQY